MNNVRLFVIVAASLVLAACAGTPVTRSTPPPVIDRSSSTPADDGYPPISPSSPPIQSRGTSVSGSTGSPAVVALLERADQQYATRDLDAAAASLERALRIEPRNAVLWHKLAAIRLEQGQSAQAVQLASKSNSFAGGDTRLQARNWRLIATARRAQGDEKGAQAAATKARQLE